MLGTFKKISIICFFSFFIFNLYAQEEAPIKATLELADVDLRADYGFETDILLELPEPYPREIILERENYRIRDVNKPKKAIEIKKVIWQGVRENEGFREVLLFGEFNRDSEYQMFITFPNKMPQIVDVGKSPDFPSEKFTLKKFVRFVGNNTALLFDVRPIITESNAIAFDYSFSLNVHSWKNFIFSDTITRIALNSDGIVATKKSSAQNNMNFSGGFSWLKIYETNVKVGKRTQPLVNSIGFRIKVFEFESNQDFSQVNYTLKPQLVFSVPYLDSLILWWHDLIGVSVNFLPPTVYVGYTVSSELQGNNFQENSKVSNRIDMEFIYNVPISKTLEMRVKGRRFYKLDADETSHLTELSWHWYLDKDRSKSLMVKYSYGALPPTFESSEATTMGFSIGF